MSAANRNGSCLESKDHWMGLKARNSGTRGKASLGDRIKELESEIFVLGEQKANLEVTIEQLVEVNDDQRHRLVDASLLRTRINELEEQLAESASIEADTAQ